MELEIVKYPALSLLEPSSDVTDFEQAMELVNSMLLLLPTLWGSPAGLAAAQVGHNVKVFLMRENQGVYRAFINPKIEHESQGFTYGDEGCYSLEDNVLYPNIKRAASVWTEYQTLTGGWRKEKFNGVRARIFQHEHDHLLGKLCNQNQ
jgi:peptide deformylase